MNNKQEFGCFDCSAPYQEVSSKRDSIIWSIDLLYNSKVVGKIWSFDKEDVLSMKERWYNNDK